MKKLISSLIALFVVVVAANAAVVNVDDTYINGYTTFYNGDEYILSGYVFVRDGDTLEIEAGAVVKGQVGLKEDASALIVAKGGVIYANGTEEQPIIMTAANDNINDPCDFGPGARGLWGGLMILGDAPISSGTADIEGITYELVEGDYGGTNPNDNSGIVRYVSIRHGGIELLSNEEINGLTLGGVGAGTTIEHVEVFANFDDGIEFFGGTVNVKWATVAFCGDDSYDYDEGWRGKGQFWLSISQDYKGNRSGEHDGCHSGEALYAEPTIANVTYIGSGVDAANDNEGVAIKFRDNAAGHYYNGLITEFNAVAFDVESDPGHLDENGNSHDAWQQAAAGNLTLDNFVVANVSGGIGSNVPASFTNVSVVADAGIRGISRVKNNPNLDPRPVVGSPLLAAGTTTPADPFFSTANYIGAFDSEDLWIKNWTALDEMGIAGKYMYLSAPTGKLTTSQQWDLNAIITIPSITSLAGLADVSFNFDGSEKGIEWYYGSRNNVQTLPEGGISIQTKRMYQYMNAVTGSRAGAHSLELTLTFNDGTVVSDAISFETLSEN